MSAAAATVGAEAKPEKVKLTKKEKEAAERELRRTLPSLSQIGRNGVFEMVGSLGYTWAAGNVPGGPFVPVNVVCRGHNMYIFDGGEAGHRPSVKPRMFFQIKRAEVVAIGLLVIPPLPPHSNVFRLSFMKKQFGHRAFFFKATSNKEMQRWMKDLEWRVAASEGAVLRRFEPDRTRAVVQKRIDETETAVLRPPERVYGLSVRYETPQEQEADLALEDF